MSANILFLLYGLGVAVALASLGWYSIKAQREDAAKHSGTPQ